MFYSNRQARILEKEVQSIREVVNELVASRLKIEFFVKGACCLYAADYFGVKEIVSSLL